MNQLHERRAGKERRKFAIYYRYGSEYRNNTRNRRLDTVEKLQHNLTGSVSQAYGRGSDKTIEIIKAIAEAFGVHPDTLEMLEHDDSTDGPERCLSCEERTRINAEFKTELAESRRNLELCRNQVGDLLLSFSKARN